MLVYLIMLYSYMIVVFQQYHSAGLIKFGKGERLPIRALMCIVYKTDSCFKSSMSLYNEPPMYVQTLAVPTEAKGIFF